MINNSSCDLYISIHLNSTTSPTWRGLQIFYSSINSKNKLLADIVNQTIKKDISNVREVKLSNDYYMYKNITIPGILIEAGFLSNANDNYLLRQDNYQIKLVNSIANGIVNYFTNT